MNRYEQDMNSLTLQKVHCTVGKGTALGIKRTEQTQNDCVESNLECHDSIALLILSAYKRCWYDLDSLLSPNILKSWDSKIDLTRTQD